MIGGIIMKAIVYEGFKNVKVREVGDPGLKNDDDIIVNYFHCHLRFGSASHSWYENNCIKVVLKP
jgi:hypothetical protein